MTYLDSLVNQLFKKSESGEPLFYPWGIFGKGYVVSSASQHSHIRSTLKVYYVVMFLAMGISIYFLDYLYTGVCVIFGIGGYLVWSDKVTRRLKVSAERLGFSESVVQGLPGYSTWGLVFMSLVSFMFVVTGGFIFYTDPSEWVMSSICIVFFGLATVIFVFMTITKLKSKRP